jgi:hypothetical protein
VFRELAYQLVNFIPNFPCHNSLATLNFFTTEVNMSSGSPNGYEEPRIARAGVQIAGLASNAFECKSGQFQLLADVSRDLQLADVERG